MTGIDWSSLQHAYGTAADIPALLLSAESAIATDEYRREPWYSLWSALCHQDDIYPASYAAVLELARIAELRADAGAIEAAFLAASIELRRNQPNAPSVPAFLVDSYRDACAQLAARLPALYAVPQRQSDPARLAVSTAVFAGDFATAVTLLGDDRDE